LACVDAKARTAFTEMCRQDMLFYVNTFVWQFNPRSQAGLEVGPFTTWEFQDHALLEMDQCIDLDEDLCIEKSREMGASWMMIILFEYRWHFRPWQKFLLISRNEKAVDDEDPDSLFWKIDFIHSHLPGWLLPKMRRRRLFFGNDDNGSTITGQASTGKAGVGGRATAMGIDEFSQIEEDFEVLHRTSDTTGCRIFNFTHKGLDTAAFQLTQRVDMRKLNLHWTQHPAKRKGMYRWDTERNHVVNLDQSYQHASDYQFVTDGSPSGGPRPGVRSPWYDNQCRRKGSARAVAMDLDIDPKGSTSQFFDPLVIHVLKQTYGCDPYWRGEIEYDKETGEPKGLTATPGGRLRLWLHPGSKAMLPKAPYCIGGDIGTGSGASPTCLSIGNAGTGEKVGEWVSARVDPHDLAPVAVALAMWFVDEDDQGAELIWETPGPGLTFGKRVLELGYRYIYTRQDEVNPTSPIKAAREPGYNTGGTGKAKTMLLEEYRAALSSRQYLNRSVTALDECLNFKYAAAGRVEHGGERANDESGASINHGDQTMADALCWRLMRARRRKVEKEGKEILVTGSLAWRRVLAERGNREARAY